MVGHGMSLTGFCWGLVAPRIVFREVIGSESSDLNGFDAVIGSLYQGTIGEW